MGRQFKLTQKYFSMTTTLTRV